MRDLEPEDLFRLAIAQSVEVSPRGDQLYYVESRMLSDENTYQKRIMVIDREKGPVRPLTTGPHDHSPSVSPDGRYLAFISKRPSKGDAQDFSQLFVLSFAGGDPVRLTDWARDVSNPRWAPDGQGVVVEVMMATGEPEPPNRAEALQRCKTTSARERHTADIRHLTDLPYRVDTTGYFDGRLSQLVFVPIDTTQPVKILTHGNVHHHSPAFSPDGQWLAYVAQNYTTAREQIMLHHLASDTVHAISPEDGTFNNPVFTPDNRHLYGFGHFYDFGFYTQSRLYRFDVNQPRSMNLIATPDDWDFGNQSLDDIHPHPGGIMSYISPDSQLLYLLASHRATVHAVAVHLATGNLYPLTSGEQVVYGLAADHRRHVFGLLQTDATQPGNVYWADNAMKEKPEFSLRLAAEPNRDLLDNVRVYLPQRFSYQAEPLGDTIDGFYIIPDTSGAAPLALEVHGGPMAMYAPIFFLEFQVLAAAGIGVVFTNPHGSRGYGQAFCASIRGAWGQQDFRDVIAGLEHALSTRHFDAQRLAILGGSYGGFMTNWAIGHDSRFTAAVTMRSVVDELSFFGTSDVGYQEGWGWGSPPWSDPSHYLRESPLMSAPSIHTPLLILHSENDYRCPISQAEELYTALKHLGRPVEFVRFPDESHELSRNGQPWHRVKRLELIRDWLVKYLVEGDQ